MDVLLEMLSVIRTHLNIGVGVGRGSSGASGASGVTSTTCTAQVA